MPTAVRSKTQKKPSAARKSAKPALNMGVEQALLALENTCMNIMESQFVHSRDDMDGLMWQRTFKNIVTPVSLALREYKGPRRFHNHYKHREDDDSVLHPVLEDPLDMLAHVCATALSSCEAQLVGLPDATLGKSRDRLESALRKFLATYADR